MVLKLAWGLASHWYSYRGRPCPTSRGLSFVARLFLGRCEQASSYPRPSGVQLGELVSLLRLQVALGQLYR